MSTVITPWYRQFWPWFLIALPATTVVAALITVFIAAFDPDDLVVADYYREGLAINDNKTRQRQAERLGLSGQLQLQDGAVIVKLSVADTPSQLNLRLVHRTLAERDRVLLLNRAADGSLSGQLDLVGDGRWTIMLEPRGGVWRLVGTLELPAGGPVALIPG